MALYLLLKLIQVKSLSIEDCDVQSHESIPFSSFSEIEV